MTITQVIKHLPGKHSQASHDPHKGGGSLAKDTYSGKPEVSKVKTTVQKYGADKGKPLKREFEVKRRHDQSNLMGTLVTATWTSATNKWKLQSIGGSDLGEAESLQSAKKLALAKASEMNEWG